VIVVDTSVAVQWLVPEEDTGLAEVLLGRKDLAAPDLLLVETANVLRKKLRAGQIVAEQATEGFEFLKANIETFIPFEGLLIRAFGMAAEIGHPVYDCMFLACAENLEGVVATRDAPLIGRAGKAGYGALVRVLDHDWSKELQ